MATRIPVVYNPTTGENERLQPGDTLLAAQSGGDDQVMTNGEAGAIVIGTPVYVDAADDVKKAQANAAGTSKTFGLVAINPSIANGVAGAIRKSGILSATTAQWDAVTGGSGGLVVNTPYYLDPVTAGKLTTTIPSTQGQYRQLIGYAISTTELDIQIQVRLLL